MKTTMIVTGHGNYATGIQSSLKLLAGHNEGLEFIDFLEEDNDTSLREKIMEAVNRNTDSQFLFVCDIVGGTPFKECAILASNSDNMEAVAGCNVGAILETVLLKDTMPLKSLASSIIDSTIHGVAKFEKININKADNSLDEEDGI
ncbi:MAG: fructose transporter subunit [Clostridiaceae bacterium]|jgi:PTS system N-acetylgalactosamine-specific IIA component|nr:fructose transporter subunit [Clostridiaceae bacterium]